LAQAFGGPEAEGEPGAAVMRQAPAERGFTEEQRARWFALAGLAADEAGLPADPEFRAALTSYLDWSSRVAAAQPTDTTPQDIPVPRWDWGPAGPPAEVPAGAGTAEDQAPVALPGPGETVSFEAHVRPLFREHDRKSMSFGFDLWSRDDVQAHAAGILERLRNGTMPCDGAWPAEKT